MIDHEQVILLLLTAQFCSEVSDINTKLIKTQFSLQQSILKNIQQVEKHFKPLEKLLTFEPNISEYNLFSDTFIYRRFKCRNTFVEKIHLHRQNILQPTLFIPHQLKRDPEWYSRLLLMFLIKFSKSCRTSLS